MKSCIGWGGYSSLQSEGYKDYVCMTYTLNKIRKERRKYNLYFVVVKHL